jgi:type IV secretory pathway VirJ component
MQGLRVGSLGLALALAFAVGCDAGEKGSGSIKTDKRTVPAFTAIELGGAYEVSIVCQKPQALEITADDNLLPLVKTEVEGGTLKVHTEKAISPSQRMKLTISMGELRGLHISGACETHAEAIQTDNLALTVSGAGSTHLAGTAKTVTLTLSGAGSVQAADLKAQNLTLECSGAGSADVFASEKLSVELSGVGSVTYAGHPKKLEKHVSGVGSIVEK